MGHEKDMEEKRYRIIGTAGHIDHGKTWLVKALTGTDTDRLAEEKRRGITIENGFAFLKFPDGREAGIIDVPGHEKFIKNMLAGAGGIDIAMVVIAADEGVMPQTREHLAILSLLGIQQGVIVLTKGDLEWKKGLDQEIREFAEGTFLENADVVVTSAVDGRGIEELRRVLWKLCTAGKTTGNQKPSQKEGDSCTGRMGTKASAFRLPIDRVFSLKGFGTVVTGTLLDGSLGLNYDAMLYPRAERVKIRGIQVHGQEVSEAVPGQRVAVNLPGIGKEQISRGEILAAAGSMEGTMIAGVRLQLLKSGQRSLKSGTRVHLYHGAAELVCKIILFDREVLKPGEEAVVQLRMEQMTAMKAGVKRKKGQNADAAVHCACTGKERKKAHAAGKITEEICGNSVFLQLQELYLKSGFKPPLTDEVKKVFSGERDFSEVFFAMVRDGVLVRFDEKHYMHREIRQKALDMVYQLFKERGMIQTGEFRDRLGISRKCAIILLEGFDRERITVMENGGRVLKRNLQQADRSQ